MKLSYRAGAIALGVSLGWLLGLPQVLHAQNQSSDALWTKAPAKAAKLVSLTTAAADPNLWVEPQQYVALNLDAVAMKATLATAPVENLTGSTTTAAKGATPSLTISLPMPDGSFQNFSVTESPVMEPALAAQFPEIKTYFAQGIDDPTATARLDFTPQGFHAQVLSPNGAVYVDPHYRDASEYVCYAKKDYRRSASEFSCRTLPRSEKAVTAGRAQARSGGNLRTYRACVAATGEYTAYQGGTLALGQAAVVTAVNRVSGVYETELAIRLVLISNNSLVVYTNSTTDPYTNDNPDSLLTENQSNLDTLIGSANYDIGHVFSTAGGGLAGLGVVCVSGQKAQGETGTTAPTGDAFWIDYVAHEMGHQFGGDHTFNSSAGSCSGNRNASTAYEVGSGNTIMAYAGICSTDDLQAHSDPYFHSGSFDEIITYSVTNGGNSCASTTATGNTAPTVSAGAAYTIPAATPFILTASGSDANGDPLTYCWEERDLGASTTATAADNGSSPIFRSFNPTTNTSRTFPQLSDVLSHTATLGEQLPTTSRTLKFRVTARDNRAGGGGVNTADTTVTTVSAAGPFTVTSHSTRVTNAGAATVTWNVAGTTASPISCANVKISLSTNGGLAFPFVLASSTLNDGTEVVPLPSLTSTNCRIKVEGVSNVFFNINSNSFVVIPGTPSPYPNLSSLQLSAENCTPTNGFIDPNETVTLKLALNNSGSANTTNLTVTLLATNGVTSPGAAVNYGALVAGGATVTQAFTFTASGTCGGSITPTFQLQDGTNSYGTIAQSFGLGSVSTAVLSYTNATLVTIRDTNSASPYPSTINVGSFAGAVTKVTVTIPSLTHTYVSDIDMLLVGPGGQSTYLMSDVSGSTSVSGISLTFDSTSANTIPASGLTSGTYAPANSGGADTFASPAPASGYVTNLNVFNGVSPVGNWQLYIMDDGAADVGTLASGWSLNLTTSTTNCCTSAGADLKLTQTVNPAATYTNGTVTFTLNLTNLGTALATNVVVSNTLPAGLKFVSASPTPNSTNAATLVFNFNSLANLASTNLSVTVLTTNTGTFTNTAYVTSLTSDPVNTNNTATASVTVNALPALNSLTLVNTNTLTLSWSTLSNLTYGIQFKTNLQQAAWVNLNTNILGTGAGFTTNLSVINTQRFFRLVVFP